MSKAKRAEKREQGSQPVVAVRWIGLATVVILAAGAIAYGNGFDGVFLFDDHTDIDGNAAIRDVSNPWRVITEQGQSGVSGRPLVALSYAVNYAWHGLELWGWHATNLAIHLIAALALFGVVRRALLLPRFAERFGRASYGIAFATALLWVVHPLTTPSVMYLGQRVESLMGMFFLIAFYAALRSFTAERPALWHVLAIASTVLSACSKEVAVALPVLVLLFDALFVAGTFASAWRARRGFYVGLFATWLVIGLLVWASQARSESVGFEYEHVGVWSYLKTQAWAVARYLRLCVWPSPLIFDYGKRPITAVSQWLPHGLFLIALLAVTAIGLVQRKPVAFLGAWWFVILAPTSSVLPIVTELIVEHRAYLPLAAVILLAVLAVHALLTRGVSASGVRTAIASALTLALATVLTFATRARNRDYRTEIGMWADVVAKLPSNDRAHASYANDLRVAGKIEDAGHHYEEASRLAPEDPYWHANLGTYYLDRGRVDDAVRELELSRAQLPTYGMTLGNLGFAYMRKGESDKAIESLEASLAHDVPNAEAVRGWLANLKAQHGK